MSARKRNQHTKEFIELYESLTCLWKVKSKEYHDRAARDYAYEQLLIKMKEMEPEATKHSVIKKINNLRTCFRKEQKKYEASKKSATSPDELYKIQLWYYDLFDFLGDQDIPRESTSNLDDEIIKHEEEGDDEYNMSSHYFGPAQKRMKSNVLHMMEENNDLLMVKQGGTKDDASVFAESWATSYRKLSPTQQIFAKKAIEDVLVLGQLNLLTLNTVKIDSEWDKMT